MKALNTCSKADKKLKMQCMVLIGNLLLDENVFKELSNLASNMLVPESELSRTTGAGAGNIDND